MSDALAIKAQRDALTLLSMPVLIRLGFRPGPHTLEVLESYREGPENREPPMEWAARVYNPKGASR